MTQSRILDALPGHVPAIAAIERDCFSMPWPEEVIAANLTDERHVMLAAVSEAEVLGYIGLMYVLDEGYISNVAVAKNQRRLGLADRLVAAMLERAAQLELAFLTLEVRASNTPARRLYEKHGFTEVGIRRGYYEQPREDAVLMTHFLP